MQINEEKCVGCGTCIGCCPMQAIIYENGKAKIDKNKCANCGTCMSVCPMQAIFKKD